MSENLSLTLFPTSLIPKNDVLVAVEKSASNFITPADVTGWPAGLRVSMLHSEKMAILSYHSSVVLLPISVLIMLQTKYFPHCVVFDTSVIWFDWYKVGCICSVYSSCNLSSVSKKKTFYSSQRRKRLHTIAVLRVQTGNQQNQALVLHFCRPEWLRAILQFAPRLKQQLGQPGACGFPSWHHPAFWRWGQSWPWPSVRAA